MKKKIIKIGYKKSFNGYVACFNIGVQTFTLEKYIGGTKKEAIWYCDMLKIAFENLAAPYFGESKSPLFKEACKGLANPDIEIKMNGLVDLNCNPKQ